MQQKKVMPRIEYQRIGDDAVVVQRCPDGTTQQIVMPLDQALVLVDWIIASAEDHGGAMKPEPAPSHRRDSKTSTEDGCTRTRANPDRRRAFFHLDDVVPITRIDGEFGRS